MFDGCGDRKERVYEALFSHGRRLGVCGFAKQFLEGNELSISETFSKTEDMVAWEIGLFARFCVSHDVFFEGVVSWKYGLMPMRVLLRRKKFCTKFQSDCR
jgi:hypothetical protein